MTLKHAVTEEQLTHGLMGYKSLPADEGMTFNFPAPHEISIWMLNCYIDLSVAFLDENKIIREIHDMKAYPEIQDEDFFHRRSITSAFPATYVLEMNKGWFVKHGIKAGDKAFWNTNSAEGWVEKQITSGMEARSQNPEARSLTDSK